MSDSYVTDLLDLGINDYFKVNNPSDWSFAGFRRFEENKKLKVNKAKDIFQNNLQSIKSKSELPRKLRSLAGNLQKQVDTRDEDERNTAPLINISHNGKVNIDSCFKFTNEPNKAPRQQEQPSSSRPHLGSSSLLEKQPQQKFSPSEPQQEQDTNEEEIQQLNVRVPETAGSEQQDDNYSSSHADSNANFRKMTPESIEDFKVNYNKMDDDMKWKLRSSGRVVEDILFEYGVTLRKESCVHSFILDEDDEELQNHFTDEEWNEIETENRKDDPPLPDNVKELLHDLNKTDIMAIYNVLKDSARRYEDHNTKCIFYALDSMLFLYESNPNPLMSCQLEQWYQANLWTPVTDKILGDLPGVICVLGESASVASRDRKRQHGKQSLRMGSRTDMIVRKSGNGVILEYGAAEDAAHYDGELGRKRCHEIKLKLPKTLKDMLGALAGDCHWNPAIVRNLEVVGYCHSGTRAEFMTLDSPSGYVCRLSHSHPHQVPSLVTDISKLLLLLSTSLRMKLRILRTMNAMNTFSLDLDYSKMATRKRKPTKCLADTLTTPQRSIKLPMKKKQNPYLID